MEKVESISTVYCKIESVKPALGLEDYFFARFNAVNYVIERNLYYML